MRADEAMTAAGLTMPGGAITDERLRAQCPSCKTSWNLSEIVTREDGQQTEYVCPTDGEAFVVVGPAPGLTGYRLRENVIHAPAGLQLLRPDGAIIEFPAT